MPADPPRLARRALAFVLRADEVSRSVLGDLDEEFADRARVDAAAARRWYWREGLAVVTRARTIGPRRRGDSAMRRFATDLLQAVRSLIKQPRFTIVSALTLALGIGAVTAIFSVVNGVLLQPLPYPNSSRLVNLWSTAPGLGYDQFPLSPDLFAFYQRHSTAFEDMGLVQFRRASLIHAGSPEAVDSAVTTPGYFSTLGATFVHGRAYTAAEDRPDAARVAVISHRLWRRTYNGDPAVLSVVDRIDGQPTQIVGVAPVWLDQTGSPDIWMPTRFPPDTPPSGNFSWNALARLKPGVRPADAAAQLEPLVRRAMETQITNSNYRAFLTDGRYRPLVHSMKEDVVGEVQQPLWILLGTVGMVLLIACANVANLCLVRAEGRQREIAVRLALGGSRRALIRGLLCESLVLAVTGAALGVALATAALPMLIRVAPASIPRLGEIRVDWTVLAVAAGAALVSALIFGLVPAIRYTRASQLGALRHGGRNATDHPSRQRGRHALVAAQTALAMVLLVGSGLLARSFSRMMQADLGFDPANVVAVRVALPSTTYREDADIVQFARRLVEGLSGLPAMESAGAAASLPLRNSASGTAFDFDGRPVDPGKLPPMVQYDAVTPGYFKTLGVKLVAGRDFDWADAREGIRQVLVNQAAAKQFWPGQDPIGKRLRRSSSQPNGAPPWFTVIGVVGDIRHDGFREPPPSLLYFLPISPDDESVRAMSYVVRGPSAGAQAAGIREAVRAIDPELPVTSIETMNAIIDRSVVQFSFTMLTLGIAAGVALLLGAIGLYSVLSYAVSLRTREIGVRLALGAPRAQVMRSIVRRGIVTSAAGLAAGALGAVGLTRLLRSLLYETTPLDPLTFASMALLLLIVAALASYLPARRAAATSPMEAMRG